MKPFKKDQSSYNTKLTILLDKLFLASNNPLSLKEILSKLENQKYNKTTIYRKLESLDQSGHIRVINLPKYKVWELSSKIKHAHFTCTFCSIVECTEVNLKGLRTLNQITETIFTGICQSCQINS